MNASYGLGRHAFHAAVHAWSLVFCTLVGCSGVEFVPVSGKILLDDQPLPNALVTFEPVGDNVERVARGKTDADGRFELETNGSPGAVVGIHRVLITTILPEDVGDERNSLPVDRVPSRYQDGSLEVEVPSGGTDAADINLSSR